MKLSNFFRSLDRMKKFDYMKESQFYKNSNRLKRKYKSSATRAEKRDLRQEIEALYESHPAFNSVTNFKRTVKKTIQTVNTKYGSEVVNEANYNDYIDFISQVSDYFEGYFYENEKALDTFNQVVTLGGKKVSDAVKEFIR